MQYFWKYVVDIRIHTFSLLFEPPVAACAELVDALENTKGAKELTATLVFIFFICRSKEELKAIWNQPARSFSKSTRTHRIQALALPALPETLPGIADQP